MDYQRKLRECRTCEEARPILETLKVRPSARKLIETAIQLNQSRDPRQQSYGEEFMLTAFREIQEAVGDGEKDINKIVGIKNTKEADEITGALDSHQSSKIDMPYPKEGTDEPQSDIESMKTASGENQMGGIRENMPFSMGGGMPGMGGMPPMPGMPPMAPDLQRQMAPQMPPMPQMNTPQMMRQMQYTVEANLKKYLTPIIVETKKLREAYIALDKKMQETENRNGTMKLDLDKIKINSPVREHNIRETVGDIELPKTVFTRFATEEKRHKIAEMDAELDKSRGTIYQ